MRSVGFAEAWSLWLAGQSVADFELWGRPMLWWGRAGKLVQFAGGLTVVLDLVGADRLRKWGQGMAKGPFRRLASRSADSVVMEVLFLAIGAFISWQLSGYLGAPARWLDAVTDQIPDIALWALLITLAGAIWLAVVAKRETSTLPWWVHRGAVALAVALGGLAVTYFVLYIVTGAIGLLGFAIVVAVWWGLLIVMEWVVARPVAWLLDRQTPGQPVRWFGVILVVVGFQFDLLAS